MCGLVCLCVNLVAKNIPIVKYIQNETAFVCKKKKNEAKYSLERLLSTLNAPKERKWRNIRNKRTCLSVWGQMNSNIKIIIQKMENQNLQQNLNINFLLSTPPNYMKIKCRIKTVVTLLRTYFSGISLPIDVSVKYNVIHFLIQKSSLIASPLHGVLHIVYNVKYMCNSIQMLECNGS